MTRANEQAEFAGGSQPVRMNQMNVQRLKDHALSFAYAGWILLALIVLGLVVASIPSYVAYLHLPKIAASLAPDDPSSQLTTEGMQQLKAWGISLHAYIAFQVLNNLVLALCYIGMSILIVWQTWRGRKDWMALIAAVALVTFPINMIQIMLETLPPWLGGAVRLLTFFSDIGLPLFCCIFPVKRFTSLWIGFLALGIVVIWGVYNFIPAASSPTSPLAAIVFILILASLVCLIGVQVYRYRRLSNQIERQQSKWVFFGMGITAGGYIIWSALFTFLFLQGLFADVLTRSIFSLSQLLLMLIIPLSIGFAILRYRLWDIDIIINRTLVYGTLTACIAGLYVMIVVSLGSLFQSGGNLLISLFGTGIVAVCIQPLRILLQRSVNRMLYGQRDEPHIVIAQLSQRLKGTLEPDAVLSTIVETVAHALKLPYVAILWSRGDATEPAASYGEPKGDLLTLPLVYQSETIGQMQLAPRTKGEAFTPVDLKFLDELALQAGLAAHAVRLATDLQKTREKLILAREEERRRLRRDLHDGVGPTLASLLQRIDTARHLVSRDPNSAVEQLGNLKTQMKSTIADIRRLVYALRPPALDELGLISAIREHVMQLQGMNQLNINVEFPEVLPLLPAAVEVAVYRIVLEALTNVERHAQARNCLVRIELLNDRCLFLSIIDDGRSMSGEYPVGVGILSMRERAAELGGECTITSQSVGGTCVAVRLPLPSTGMSYNELGRDHSNGSDSAVNR